MTLPNLTTALIKASGAPTPRTLTEHLGNVMNVKGFGAKGDGVTDDGPSIQATFDAAFGPADSPHGVDNRYLNRPVYIPAGNYKVGAPLYLTRVTGGHIFGDGANSTRLFYAGSFGGNSLAPSTGGANLITPLIMTNGFNYSRIERLNLSAGDNNTTCFYLWGIYSCNANIFSDLLVDGATQGILVGYQTSSVSVSECLFINVTIGNCSFAGLRVIGQNTLNHQVYGGGAFTCSRGYSVASGSISLITGSGNADNGWDIENLGALPIHIVGGRTESLQFLKCQGGSFASVQAFVQDHASATVFADLGSSGTVVADASLSIGTAATIVGSAGSRLYLRGCTFTNPNVISAFTGTLGQNI